MNELIKITTSAQGAEVVSGRDLHKFLEATERFSAWFDRQLSYGFTENVDFTGCKVFNALANQEVTDYAITVDMAKEVAMIQRSEKGKQIRQWFIEREKQLRIVEQKPTSQIDLIIQSAHALKAFETKQYEHDIRISQLEAQSTLRPDTYTIAGYATIRGIKVGIQIASILGKIAKKICRDHGWTIETMPDPRFGRVNVYPTEALKRAFNIHFGGN